MAFLLEIAYIYIMYASVRSDVGNTRVAYRVRRRMAGRRLFSAIAPSVKLVARGESKPKVK